MSILIPRIIFDVNSRNKKRAKITEEKHLPNGYTVRFYESRMGYRATVVDPNGKEHASDLNHYNEELGGVTREEAIEYYKQLIKKTEKGKLPREKEDEEHKTKKILINDVKVSIDIDIIPLVQALNSVGISTYESCQGDIYSSGEVTPGFIIADRKIKQLLPTLKSIDPNVIVKYESGTMGYAISDYDAPEGAEETASSLTFTVKSGVGNAGKVLADFYLNAANAISGSSVS
jgi:hypothetical protein